MGERYRVKETTKTKDDGERPQESISLVMNSYEGKGKLNDNIAKNAIRLKEDPRGEIKVYLKSYKGKQFHIGYVEKRDLEEVRKKMVNSVRFDAEFHESSYERTALDEKEQEYVVDVVSVVDVFIHPVNIVQASEGSPFLRPGDGSTKTKILNRIGCGLMLFILLMIILIIFF